MTAPLEDYGMIGDGQTAALVCRNGSIDWLCWPRFDSDACFAALLGRPENGRWLIGPEHRCETARRYQPDTLILETDHACDNGTVRVVDFMPPGQGSSALIRQVSGLRGRVGMVLDLAWFRIGRFWVTNGRAEAAGRCGPDLGREGLCGGRQSASRVQVRWF
jgi:GH15 family glucan-1,4-alpha-glucosidase